MTRPLLASLLVLTLALHACAMNASPPRLANPDPASHPPSTARDRAPPADGVITVRPGDTVYAVARPYGRSEARRVGQARASKCRSPLSPYHSTKKYQTISNTN